MIKLENIGYILYNTGRGRNMPTISSFYGIIIMMYLFDKEHNPPHIHAFYGEFDASFRIDSDEILEEIFPKNGVKLVREFIHLNQNELQEMWDSGIYKKLPPLR